MSQKPMPEGAGGVRCPDCGAHAAADGKGGTIALRHEPGCPTAAEEAGRRRAEDFVAVNRALQALSRAWIYDRVPTEAEGLTLCTQATVALSHLAVNADVPLDHARHLLNQDLQAHRAERERPSGTPAPSPGPVGGVGADARGRVGGGD